MILAGPITLDGEAIAAILAVLALAAIVDLLVVWGLVRWGVVVGHLLAGHPEPWWHPKAGVAASTLAATMSPLVTGAAIGDAVWVLVVQGLLAVAFGTGVGALSPSRG